jgi:hypothetical protein
MGMSGCLLDDLNPVPSWASVIRKLPQLYFGMSFHRFGAFPQDQSLQRREIPMAPGSPRLSFPGAMGALKEEQRAESRSQTCMVDNEPPNRLT